MALACCEDNRTIKYNRVWKVENTRRNRGVIQWDSDVKCLSDCSWKLLHCLEDQTASHSLQLSVCVSYCVCLWLSGQRKERIQNLLRKKKNGVLNWGDRWRPLSPFFTDHQGLLKNHCTVHFKAICSCSAMQRLGNTWGWCVLILRWRVLQGKLLYMYLSGSTVPAGEMSPSHTHTL